MSEHAGKDLAEVDLTVAGGMLGPMNVDELVTLKSRMNQEARKWVAYLRPLPIEEAERELTRKLVETFLEGWSRR